MELNAHVIPKMSTLYEVMILCLTASLDFKFNVLTITGWPTSNTTAKSFESISKLNNIFKSFRNDEGI